MNPDLLVTVLFYMAALHVIHRPAMSPTVTASSVTELAVLIVHNRYRPA
ncbi:MAG: hypothetical protein OXH96_13720 [Spirochaetaceae bacterium]|nr:hypothetical protein [Spirochaetaceae bacterium]